MTANDTNIILILVFSTTAILAFSAIINHYFWEAPIREKKK